MHALRWIVAGLIAIGLAVLAVVFGTSLMPSRIVAQGKGTLIPWLFTWGLIWISAVSGVIIATYRRVDENR